MLQNTLLMKKKWRLKGNENLNNTKELLKWECKYQLQDYISHTLDI